MPALASNESIRRQVTSRTGSGAWTIGQILATAGPWTVRLIAAEEPLTRTGEPADAPHCEFSIGAGYVAHVPVSSLRSLHLPIRSLKFGVLPPEQQYVPVELLDMLDRELASRGL